MNPADSPLDEGHYDKIKIALAACVKARNQISLARAAGIDVSDAERQLDEAEAKLRQVKQVYFPGRA